MAHSQGGLLAAQLYDDPALAGKADRMDGQYIGEDVVLVDDVVIDARRI